MVAKKVDGSLSVEFMWIIGIFLTVAILCISGIKGVAGGLSEHEVIDNRLHENHELRITRNEEFDKKLESKLDELNKNLNKLNTNLEVFKESSK